MTTNLDPLRASRRIEDEYRRYLRSTFPLRRRDLARAFSEQLSDGFRLSRGPILQASAPYVAGASVEDLVGEGLLSERFRHLSAGAFPTDRPLYAHQERAIRKAVGDRRNLVVATGTGSGKTECFLLPILDGLLREADDGTLTQPGVRALLLYPMNALANDQLKRLRVLLRDLPDVTFGRYVGETKARQRDAEADFRTRYPSEQALENELISREVMQERPPHILLTNYAMLEYLLLRPNDTALFDGPTGGRWRQIALDEVHVYGGAQGTEIGMLLRRLRDRVTGSRPGALQCFGTSATLGRGVTDYPELVAFARNLFAEPFEWESDDPARQDVIGAQRRPLVRAAATRRLEPETITALRSAYREGAPASQLGSLSGVEPHPGENPEAYLARLLSADERTIALQEQLQGGSVDLRAAAHELFESPRAQERLVELVDVGVAARARPDDAPVIPARYHFFLRALEGAFVCLHPEHDEREPALLLARHQQCPSCVRRGLQAAMFELGVCRRCGSEYLVGAREATSSGGYRIGHASPSSVMPVRALLGEPLGEDEDDEDQNLTQTAGDAAVAISLCPGCGAIAETGAPRCGCAVAAVRVWLARNAREDGALRRCLACGHRPGSDPIYRFLTGSDAPVSVVATDLYQEIPPSQDPALRDEVGQGRKLLAFSDSRQDAAFFAPFLERTYRRAVQRRLIAQALASFGADNPRLGDLVDPVVRLAERALVLDPDDGRVANRRAASTWLMRELLALDRRQSLEGTGVAQVRVAFPRRCVAPPPLIAMGFSEDEALDLVRLLLDTVRAAGAVTMLEGVDVRDAEFAPRNREVTIRGQGTAANVLAWLPTKNLNGRLDILRRVFAAKGVSADPAQVLNGLWRMLTDRNGPWVKLLIQDARSDGPVWRLDAERFELVAKPEAPRLRCSRCSQLWWYSVAGICPSFRCDGRVTPDPGDTGEDDHYARLYRELQPLGMAVQEHTAQWRSQRASAIQDDFVAGRVNVLSCSTTFELGVDVGEVQAVLLRNVPPSPANYVQRAGRAGRRTDSAALVVTYAQRRSHDLTYFETPHAMVDGTIPAPRVVLDNGPIVRRHLHSVAFAAFQREVGDHRTVEQFFVDQNGTPSRSEQFIAWLRTHPPELADAARRIVPAGLHEALGLDEWRWVDALIRPSEEEPSYGWLERARAEISEDIGTLQELIAEASAAEQFGRAGQLKRLRSSVLDRQLLGFLGSRNVLPKYGFPVDVVELNLSRSGDEVAGNLELSRDLALAIADYAPGAVTVAAKRQWRSIGLVRRADREWPQYAWVRCASCRAFRHALVEVSASCPECGSVEQADHGRFVLPIYGFAGEPAEAPGETRPIRRTTRETFFGSYRDAPPALEEVAGLRLRRRFSRQGRITVLNKGPLGRGFRICEWCGFGQPVDGTRAPASHHRIDHPGRPCGGSFAHLHLGHEFLTDVLELQLDAESDPDALRSALYALLEAAPRLDVAREDVDGTLHAGSGGLPSLVLFDAVPGGAGHVQRLGRRLPELLAAAEKRVAHCECGEETSCYGCLRGYRNQIFHEQLSRRAAISALKGLRG